MPRSSSSSSVTSLSSHPPRCPAPPSRLVRLLLIVVLCVPPQAAAAAAERADGQPGPDWRRKRGGGPAFVGQVFTMLDPSGNGLMDVTTRFELPHFLTTRTAVSIGRAATSSSSSMAFKDAD